MKNPKQNQKQRDLSDASKEENYYNSESEGKEYKDFDEKYDAYIQATCEETFGKENCYEETYRQETYNTEEKKNNSQET
jgi:hypothetical protein